MPHTEVIPGRWYTPNLDNMNSDQLRDFARQIPGDVPAGIRRDLRAYADNRIAAMAWKAVGRTTETRRCFNHCEMIYERIPARYRWY